MKVEELPSYGNAFDHMPFKAQLLQMKVMLSELRAHGKLTLHRLKAKESGATNVA